MAQIARILTRLQGEGDGLMIGSEGAKKSYVEDAKKHLNAIRDYLKK